MDGDANSDAGAGAGAAGAAGASEEKISTKPFTAVNSVAGFSIDGSEVGIAIDSGIRTAVGFDACGGREGVGTGAPSTATSATGVTTAAAATETGAVFPFETKAGTAAGTGADAGADVGAGAGAETNATAGAFGVPRVTDSTTARTASAAAGTRAGAFGAVIWGRGAATDVSNVVRDGGANVLASRVETLAAPERGFGEPDAGAGADSTEGLETAASSVAPGSVSIPAGVEANEVASRLARAVATAGAGFATPGCTGLGGAAVESLGFASAPAPARAPTPPPPRARGGAEGIGATVVSILVPVPGMTTVSVVAADCFGAALVGTAVVEAMAGATGAGDSGPAMRRDAAKDPADSAVVTAGSGSEGAEAGVPVPAISDSGAGAAPVAGVGGTALTGTRAGGDGVWSSWVWRNETKGSDAPIGTDTSIGATADKVSPTPGIPGGIVIEGYFLVGAAERRVTRRRSETAAARLASASP